MTERDQQSTARIVPLRQSPIQEQRIDPLLLAILGKLPSAGSKWPMKDRLIWFQIFELAVRLIHGGPEIKITLEEGRDD